MVSGFGESKLDEMIAPIYTLYENPVTATLFSRTEIEVQLTATAPTAEAADALNEELAAKICDRLGVAVFSTNGEPMEEVVGKMLRNRGETLATAESCTGGLVGERITEIAGSSDYYIEGLITYANEAKTRLLGVPTELIAEKGAVSAEVAEAMADGARQRAGTTYAVSITGVAGPSGGSEEKPVGTVFVGYSGPDGTLSMHFTMPGDRHLVRWRSSQAALDLLRRQILKRE